MDPSSGSICKSKKESARSNGSEPRVENLVQKCHSKWAQRDGTEARGKATSVSPLKGHM